MNKKINELQKRLEIKNIYKFKICYYKDFILKVVGSNDSDEHYNIEITFEGVSFMLCPTQFEATQIRLGTKDEWYMLQIENGINYLEKDDSLFYFAKKEGAKDYCIFAEDFNFMVKCI